MNNNKNYEYGAPLVKRVGKTTGFSVWVVRNTDDKLINKIIETEFLKPLEKRAQKKLKK